MMIIITIIARIFAVMMSNMYSVHLCLIFTWIITLSGVRCKVQMVQLACET